MIHRICSGVTVHLLCIALLLTFLPLSPLLNSAFSKQSLSNINKKIKRGEKKGKEIDQEIQIKKKQVQAAKRKEKSILTRIDTLEKRIKEQEAEIKAFARQISDTEIKILALSKEIEQLKGKLDKKSDYLSERLRTLYKQQYNDNVLLLISAQDHQDLTRKSKYISLLAFQDSKVLKTYRNEIGVIESRKKEMEQLIASLKQSKKESRKKIAELETDRVKKGKLLATIKSKRSTYERTIKELKESSARLQKMLETLKKKKVPELKTGKGFNAYRGHLPWPVPGKVVVPFGKYNDPKFNITVFKNGIELETTPDDRPRAVADGSVVYADWFKGYGLLLIINHGNGYHSLYGNLSEIFNNTGDIIKRGTVLGKTGTSRLLNRPTLYFEIRHKGKPVDPLKWLKNKKRKSRRY